MLGEKFGKNKEKQQAPPKPLPQQIWEAASAQDAATMERLCMELHARGELSADALGWADASGRTPLMVSAVRNDSACAKVLIKYGADVSACNPAVDATGGTALHEASRCRNEALAELLLSNGANPFQCNAVGKTCMDEAVRSGSSYLIKRYEQMAYANCEIAIKVTKMLGRQEWKTFRVVCMPVTLFARPEPGYSTVKGGPKVRLQMWIYKAGEVMLPLSRVWLDNAEVDRFSPVDMTLKLDPNHEPFPGEFVTAKADGGRTTLFIRSADGTKATSQAIDQLLGVVKGHITMSIEQQEALASGATPLVPLAAAAAAAAPLLPVSVAVLPGDMAAAVPSIMVGGVAYHSMPPAVLMPAGAGLPAVAPYVGAYSVPNLVQPVMPAAAWGALTAAGAAAAGAMSPPHPSRTSASSSGPTSMQRSTGGRFDSAPLTDPPPPPPVGLFDMGPDPGNAHMWGGHSVIVPSSSSAVDVAVAAAAGYAGYEGYARYAAATSAPLPRGKAADDEISQYQPPPPPPPALPPGKAAMLSDEQLAEYQPLPHDTFAMAALAAAIPQAAYASEPGDDGGGDGAAAGPSTSSSAAAAAAVAGGSACAGATPSASDASSLPSSVVLGGTQSSAAAASGSGTAGVVAGVRGPMLEVTPSMLRNDDLPEDELCVVCLSRPREAGFLHGETVHRCVCKSCSAAFKRPGVPCPLCRAPVERVIASVF